MLKESLGREEVMRKTTTWRRKNEEGKENWRTGKCDEGEAEEDKRRGYWEENSFRKT